MQLDVSLQEPFSYSKLGLIMLILLIVALIIYILVKLIIKLNKNKPQLEYVPIVNVGSIKDTYIKQIDELKDNVNNKKISDRRAYNDLSSIIRKFIYEATNIDVMKCSLNDIKKLKMHSLTKLVEEYYEPEFSYEGKGDILSSIDKTKEVIMRW